MQHFKVKLDRGKTNLNDCFEFYYTFLFNLCFNNSIIMNKIKAFSERNKNKKNSLKCKIEYILFI